MLKALFERTFAALSPAGQRVFFLLSSWKAFVPAVAVEAVFLRPRIDRFDVAKALEELHRFSFIDRIASEDGDELFVGVTLAAAMYGRSKLDASHIRAAVAADRKFLIEFGAAGREGVHKGVFPRVLHLIQSVAKRVNDNPKDLEEHLPVLEYLASRVPDAYMSLADLILEIDDYSGQRRHRAKGYVQSFLEKTENLEKQKLAWKKMQNLCRLTKDIDGEVHAICTVALLPGESQEDLSLSVNHLNSRLRDIKEYGNTSAQSESVRENLLLVVGAMEKRRNELSATGCSRLAWLYLNVGREGQALDTAKIGVERDPKNEHCQKLIQKLEA